MPERSVQGVALCEITGQNSEFHLTRNFPYSGFESLELSPSEALEDILLLSRGSAFQPLSQRRLGLLFQRQQNGSETIGADGAGEYGPSNSLRRSGFERPRPTSPFRLRGRDETSSNCGRVETL